MNTSDCLHERHFTATGPAAYAKGHANQADKYVGGWKGDKKCLCSAGRAASAAPAYGLSRRGLIPGVRSAATRSLCSAGPSLLPGGKRASFSSPGAGRGHEHLQGWSRLWCPFSPASPALQRSLLPKHFGFCCGRIALLRNPTSGFSCTTQRLSKMSRGGGKNTARMLGEDAGAGWE